MLALLALLALTPGAAARGEGHQATAGDKETARALMDKGDRKLRAGDYRGALDAYAAADKIMRVPTTGIEVGRMQEKLGRLLEARDTWLRVARYPVQLDEPEPFTEARTEARALAAAVGSRIPSLKVDVVGVAPGTRIKVRIDGNELPPDTHRFPRKVNPGEKLIQASAPGYEPAGEHVMLQESQELVVELVLKPAKAGATGARPVGPNYGADSGTEPEGGGISPLVWIGFGVGVVGLGVGAVTGGLSLAKTSELKDDHCVDNSCPPDVQEDIDSAEVLANVSNVAFAVGGAGVVLGIIGIVLSGDDEPEPAAGTGPAVAVEPMIGAGFAGLTGRF